MQDGLATSEGVPPFKKTPSKFRWPALDFGRKGAKQTDVEQGVAAL